MSENETSANINNLQEALSLQQQKISALREMVRKAESTNQNKIDGASTTEKVRNINKKLNQLKAKARGNHYTSDASTSSIDLKSEEKESLNPTMSQICSSEQQVGIVNKNPTGSEKVLLLRQQMEQNKLRMAQRATSKLHLEQLVSELKEKLDSTQQSLDDTTELGKSMTDLSGYAPLTRSNSSAHSTNASVVPISTNTTTATRHEQRHRSATDLTTTLGFNLEKERIKFLENRCRLLEKQLEKEKQAYVKIEATKQAELESNEQSIRNKELENRIIELEQQLQEKAQEIETKSELELNEQSIRNKELETRITELEQHLQEKTQEMEIKSSENELRTAYAKNDDDLRNLELERLHNENSKLKVRITELEEINDVLETTRNELVNSNSEYREKLQQMEDQLRESEESFAALKSQLDESKKSTTKTIECLNSESIIDEINENTETRVRSEMAKQIQELQSLNELLKIENNELKSKLTEQEKLEVNDEQIKAKIIRLESTIESQRDDLTIRQNAFSKLEEELMEKTIELNVLNANFHVLEEKLQTLNKTKCKILFSTTGNESGQDADADLQAENQQLKQKLDESNKAMIKLKLKSKQTEKQMEKLKKSSKLHEELIELQKANEELQQRIIELEDEKGQWQLQQVEVEFKVSENQKDEDNGNEKEKTHIETIKLLEEQKSELAQQIELNTLNQQNKTQDRVVIARVETNLTNIELEEKLEQKKDENSNLQKNLEDKIQKCNELEQQIEELQLNKQTLEKKLEHYINENIELLDKVEKLSKSSSSAESIEIVERLTQQEHAEMNEFNKQLQRSQTQEPYEHELAQHVDELTQTEMGYELSDSLIKLREESSELMNKVAMFTTERHEVLEKMEQIKNENHELKSKIEILNEEKHEMLQKITNAEKTCAKFINEIQDLSREKELLSTQIAESNAQKTQLSSELTSMQKSSEIVAALDNNDGCATLFEKCEKSLSKLATELEAYRRANDKNAKFNVSKKLAKEAKNAHTQLSELLQKVKEASNAIETVTVVETVVAVTAPNGKALAEYEQLTAQNRELKSTVNELRSKLHELEDARVHDEPISDELIDVKPSETIEQDNQRLNDALAKLKQYEAECFALKANVDDLRLQLSELNISNEFKSGEITRLKHELDDLRKISENFEKLLNDKHVSYERQVQEFTRMRKDLEANCKLYEGELEIMQTLIDEQKQQLIEAYKEHEHEMNLKMLELQQRDEQITKLRTELTELCQASRAAGAELTDNLENECEKLKETLRITKTLNSEQINELANKQETIDMLNQQLIELYKTMEENTNKVIEKEDEIAELETKLTANNIELERLRKDNEEQKSVVDKLLNELHSHKENHKQILQLEHEVQALNKTKFEMEQAYKDLEKRNKEQLEKMKKFAANLKKRSAQCQELEAKMKELEMQQEFSANVVLLNERISDHELKIKTQEDHLIEIQEALQAKTIELLETMENNNKLEQDLQEIRNELMQRDEDVIQLKNALAASRTEQTITTTTTTKSDWGDSSQIEEHAAIKELEKIQALQLEINDYKQKFEQATASEVLNQQLIKKLEEQLQAKSLKFEKSKTIIKERNNQIQRLQTQLKELQAKLATQPEEELPIEVVKLETIPKTEFEALKSAYELINNKYNNEKLAFEQTIERLETLHDGIQAKLQEDMAYIENLEQENSSFKEKICKLEECIGTFEERRASMEFRVHVLDEEMQTRANEYVKAEDELIYRLNMLAEHDEVIAQRLLKSQENKDELEAKLEELQCKYAELSTQYTKLEKEHKNLQAQSETHLVNELQTLKTQFATSQNEMARMQAQYDAKLAVKTTEIDELECELSEQLASINAEKRTLKEDLEKSNDEIIRLNESLNALEQSKQEFERELTWLRMQNVNAEQSEYELQELRMQNMQDKNELDNLQQQIEAISTNHQAELNALRMQSSQDKNELDNLQQQIEAMAINHQAELNALRMQSSQDKNELDNLQQQIEALTTNHQAELNALRMQTSQDKNELDNLQQQIEAMAINHQVELNALRMQSSQDKNELDNLQQQIESLNSNHQAENDALRLQISELDSLRMQVGQNQTDDQVFIESENKRLSDLLQEKEALLADYQHQNLQLQMAASISSPIRNSQQSTENVTTAAEPIVTQQQNLTQELTEKLHIIAKLQNDLDSMREINTELQMELYEKQQQLETMNSHSSQTNSNIIIPAPPMFFANNQMATTTFDEIVQPVYADASTAITFEQPTIEDLQRNVSDLEKYNHELENKLSTRNSNEDELRQCLHQREQETKHLNEQLQLTKKSLQDLEQQHLLLQSRITELEAQLIERDNRLMLATNTQIQLDSRIIELEALLKERNDEQLKLANVAELEQRVLDLEQLLKKRENEVAELEMEQRLSSTASALESQILTPTIEQNLGPSLDMYFGNTMNTAFEEIIKPTTLPEISNESAIEDVIVPEKAYICYKKDETTTTTQNVDNLNIDLDDDAHWCANEAAAEEKYFTQTNTSTLLTQAQKLELQLQTANERVQELERKLAVDELQKQKIQEKLFKSMKVVSKYKAQNEQLKKQENNNGNAGCFNDLDAAIQDELKSQISILEAKLAEQQKAQQEIMHENEKLLKRIDVLTAGNERMTEMKERQDMHMEMYKTRINELQQKLNKLENWSIADDDATIEHTEIKQTQITNSNESKADLLEVRIKTLNTEIVELNGDKEELQALLEEERANAARLEQISKAQILHIQKEMEAKQAELTALLEAYRKLQLEHESLEKDLEKLKKENFDNNEKLKEKLKHSQDEVENLKQKYINLKQQMNEEQEINTNLKVQIENLKKISTTSSNNEFAVQEIQEKDAEILHLKQRIENLMREDQTEKLVLEILSKNQEIHLLKMQVNRLEEDKLELEHNLSMQINKEMEKQQDDTSKDLTEKLKILEKQFTELQNEKQQMEIELNVLNSHVLNSLELENKLKTAAALEADMKNIEIKELRQTLESLKRVETQTNESTASEVVMNDALNKRWEALVEQRCFEIAQMWRTHMEERENEFQKIEQQLKLEIETLKKSTSTSLPTTTQRSVSIDTTSAAGSAGSSTPVSTTVSATSTSSSSADSTPLRIINQTETDADEIIAKMQTALENQEMEIVSLKEQLAIRSAEYARLAAQYDPFKLQSSNKTISLDSQRAGGLQRGSSGSGSGGVDNNNAKNVPKSELDLALYMLHQRDMRCEELTVELVALMEERDILQLKLSNTLRQVETIKTQTGCVEPNLASADIVSSTVTNTVPAAISTTDSPAKIMTTSTSDDSANQLNQKLSQLQTVSHSKDKIIKEERERRIRQMERIQQDVARIPTAAVSELIGADISHTSQTPSTALLNWLWGNKPPATGDNKQDMN